MKQTGNLSQILSGQKLSYHERGFTLIEVLTTIVITSILLVMAIPSFRTYKYRNDLSRGAEMVQSGIYEARNYALAPLSDKAETTKYYAIRLEGNGYRIYETAETSLANATLVTSTTLPNNVIFDTDNTIYFSIEDQSKIKELIPSGEDELTVLIKNNKLSDESVNININKITGQVRVVKIPKS